MFLFYRRNLVSPELAKPSYQFILQGESIQTSLLSIQIDKFETLTKNRHLLHKQINFTTGPKAYNGF